MPAMSGGSATLMHLHTLGRTRQKARPTPGLPGDGQQGQVAGALLPAGSQVASGSGLERQGEGSIPQAPSRTPSPVQF